MKYVQFRNGMKPSFKIAAEWFHCKEDEVAAKAAALGLVIVDDEAVQPSVVEDVEEQALAEPTTVDEEPEDEDSFLDESEDESEEEDGNDYPEGGEF
jgi:hypothetical protein